LSARLRRILFSFRPEELVTLFFFLPVATTLAWLGISHKDVLEGAAAGYPRAFVRLGFLLVATAWFLWVVKARPQWEFARDAMPFLFCANIYANLHDLIRFYGARDITADLYRWDVKLFGFEPTIWAQRFTHPLLTDYFTICYWMFYVLGPTLGLLLYLKREWRAFRYTLITIVLCLYLGYMGYVVWPASAPRLYMPEAYTVPLHGSAALDYTRRAVAAIPLTAKGAFPSLHCAVALLALLLAWRHLRWFFWVMLPFTVGLILGTVYLRHHWVVDILAGFVLTFFSLWAGPRIDLWWSHRATLQAREQDLRSEVPTRKAEAAMAREVMES